MGSSTRDRVLQELLSTEEVYVKSLDSAMAIMTELMGNSRGLDKADVPAMFSNLPAISSFHKTFLQTLQESTSVGQVADVFLKYAPFMKMYTSYLTGYEESNRILGKAKSSREWNRYHEKIRKRFQSDLPSLLIQPVQRIPRYVMLLAQLKKFTDESEAGAVHEKLEEGRQKLDDIAQHINEWKRQSESMAKLVSIQNKVSGGLPSNFKLVEPHRRVVREGNVSKLSSGRMSSKTKSRTVFLFTDILMWTSPTYKFKAYLPLKDMKVTAKEKNAFFVETRKGSETFHCTSAAERDEWIEEIEKSIEARAERFRGRYNTDRTSKVHSMIKNRLQTLQSNLATTDLETPESSRSSTLTRSSTDTSPIARTASRSVDQGIQRSLSDTLDAPETRPSRGSMPSIPDYADDSPLTTPRNKSPAASPKRRPAASPKRSSGLPPVPSGGLPPVSRGLPPVPKFDAEGEEASSPEATSSEASTPTSIISSVDRLLSVSDASDSPATSQPNTPRSSNKTRHALRESRIHLIHRLSMLNAGTSGGEPISDKMFEEVAASEVAQIADQEQPVAEWFEMLMPMKSGAIRQTRRDSMSSISSFSSIGSLASADYSSAESSPAVSCRNSRSSLLSLAHKVGEDGQVRPMTTEDIESAVTTRLGRSEPLMNFIGTNAPTSRQGGDDADASPVANVTNASELRLAAAVALKSGGAGAKEAEAAASASSGANGDVPANVELPHSNGGASGGAPTPSSTPHPSDAAPKLRGPAITIQEEESGRAGPKIESPRHTKPMVAHALLRQNSMGSDIGGDAAAATAAAANGDVTPPDAFTPPDRVTPANTPQVTPSLPMTTPAPSRQTSQLDMAPPTSKADLPSTLSPPQSAVGITPANTPAPSSASTTFTVTPANTPSAAPPTPSPSPSPASDAGAAAQPTQASAGSGGLPVPRSPRPSSRLVSPVLSPPMRHQSLGVGKGRTPALVVTSPRVDMPEHKADGSNANGGAAPAATGSGPNSLKAERRLSVRERFKNAVLSVENHNNISNILKKLNHAPVSKEQASKAAEKAREESDGKVFSKKSVSELRRLFERKANDNVIKQNNLKRPGRKPKIQLI